MRVAPQSHRQTNERAETMEVTSFKFEELTMDLLGVGLFVGMLDGEAHIDSEGAILSITFEGTDFRGKSSRETVDVPHPKKTDLTRVETIINQIVDHLYGGYEQQIAEALDDWRISLRERDYEAA